MSAGDRGALREGQIVYVHHLHLDAIDLHRDGRQETKEWWTYAVKGKPRRMLVIGSNGEKSHGVQWYWVLKLTSLCGTPNAAQRRCYVRLGDVLGDGIKSYVERKPYSYPENLFSDEVAADLGRHGLQAVLAIVKHRPGGPL